MSDGESTDVLTFEYGTYVRISDPCFTAWHGVVCEVVNPATLTPDQINEAAAAAAWTPEVLLKPIIDGPHTRLVGMYTVTSWPGENLEQITEEEFRQCLLTKILTS